MNKRLKFEFQFLKHKWPVIAFGFLGRGSEFVIVLWLAELRISWGY